MRPEVEAEMGAQEVGGEREASGPQGQVLGVRGWGRGRAPAPGELSDTARSPGGLLSWSLLVRLQSGWEVEATLFQVWRGREEGRS